MERSLITLKALTYRHTGGIVAAPTTSLPECIGGERNWDYRYCWLRDATFTLLALMNAGYFEEAKAWHDWLLRAVAGSPDQVQIMYGIRGERNLMEWEVPGWRLREFQASAGRQCGLRADAVGCLWRTCRRVAACLIWAASARPRRMLACKRRLTEHLATMWDHPTGAFGRCAASPQHFTYSKVMAWVAFDRVIKAMEKSVDQRVTCSAGQRYATRFIAMSAKRPTTRTGQLHASLRVRRNWMLHCC